MMKVKVHVTNAGLSFSKLVPAALNALNRPHPRLCIPLAAKRSNVTPNLVTSDGIWILDNNYARLHLMPHLAIILTS
jgi:hypothetical protein